MKSTFFLLLLLHSSTALAQRSPAEAPLPEPRIRSADYRYEQTFQIMAGVGSVVPYLGLNVNAGYFLGPDDLVTASYTEGVSLTDFLESLFLMGAGLKTAKVYTLGYKHFIEGSFYLEGAVFFRRLDQDFRVYQFSGDSQGISFAMGHQWQWPTFTLGCDWIGVQKPLNHGSIRIQADGDADPVDLMHDQREFKTSQQQTLPILLRFYLGYSF